MVSCLMATPTQPSILFSALPTLPQPQNSIKKKRTMSVTFTTQMKFFYSLTDLTNSILKIYLFKIQKSNKKDKGRHGISLRQLVFH
jgi:hypothetical protein